MERRSMIRLLLALLLLLGAAPAWAGLTEAQLAGVSAAPPALGTRLPAFAFRDQDGRPRRLTDLVGGKPTILLFADYTCRNVCGPGLTLTAGALHDAGLAPGRDYRLVTIGLDPKDGPDAARRMRDAHLRSLPAEGRAAVLLSGDGASIGAATRALGYRAVYDPTSDQYAHDAAAYVFARDGGLVATLSETGTPAAVIKATVAAAAADREPEPSPIAQAITLCFGLGAVHGPYAKAIVGGLRLLGAALVAGALLWFWRLRAKARPC